MTFEMSSNETYMHDEGGGNLVQDGNEPQVAQDVRDGRQTDVLCCLRDSQENNNSKDSKFSPQCWQHSNWTYLVQALVTNGLTDR